MLLREVNRLSDRDCWIDAVFVGIDHGPQIVLTHDREVRLEVTVAPASAEQATKVDRLHRVPASALDSVSFLKVVVFGSGLDVSPISEYVDAPVEDTQTVSFNILPERTGPACVRIELVADGEAVYTLDCCIVIADNG